MSFSNDYKKSFLEYDSRYFKDFLSGKRRNLFELYIGVENVTVFEAIIKKIRKALNSNVKTNIYLDYLTFTVEEGKTMTGFSGKKQRDAIFVLERAGLISSNYFRVHMGKRLYKVNRFVCVNFDKIENFIKKYSDFLEVMNIKEKNLNDFGELLEEEEWIPPEEK